MLSPYDEAVPHPAPDPQVAARFRALRAVRPAVDLDAVRDVVLLVSSSRGGSSMLAEILRHLPGLLSLPGEMNPHVVVAQLDSGSDGGDVVRAEVARDVGRPVAPGEHVDCERLVQDMAWRLAAQWPTVPVSADDVRSVLSRCEDVHDMDRLTVEVLRALDLPGVTADAYDLAGAHGEPPAPEQPVVEMTPYIGFRAWRAPTADELGSCPLVLATPRNAYRLDWLRALFAPARVRLLHLTRNPAAAVNGLIDGWHHRGFFTTTVPGELDIAGYSDTYPWGRRWWKYDVPPTWQRLVAAPLPVVAAQQWRTAHEAVLGHVAATDVDVLRVRYEDVVGTREQRVAVGSRLAAFLGTDEAATVDAVVTGTRPVMATRPPAQRRWSRSDHDLAPALGDPEVWETAVALDYEVDERLWI
jgi:hypothetical protein